MKIFLKKNIINIILNIIFIILCLNQCEANSSKENNYKINNYEYIKNYINNGDCKKIIKKLENINNNISDEINKKIQLNLAYCYYKTNDLIKSKNIFNSFINKYKDFKNMDYLLYMNGLIYMSLDFDLFQNIFNIDYLDKNYLFVKKAFLTFKKLVTLYPNSKFTNDSFKRLYYLKNRLANYNKKIAEFYFRKKAYISVINIVNTMLFNYPDTESTKKSLYLMKKSYNKLHLFDEEKNINEIINLNIN